MLLELRVRNFLLIELLELRLEPGFNVLTGETGAGKSIVIGALNLVLGGRAAPDWVRPGSEEAEVEALFDVEGGAKSLGEAVGIELDGDEVALRRVLHSSGRSRAYLNGRLCPAQQLAALGSRLVDISSQHQSVALTDPATHLGYLDAFARLQPERGRLADIVGLLFAKSKELASLREAERSRGEREGFLQFQLVSIEEVAPEGGESERLGEERERLRYADKLGSLTRNAADRLHESDDALCDQLGRLASEVRQASTLDPKLVPIADTVDSARVELLDAARYLSHYAEAVQADPARLAEIEERLFRIQKLVRQHGSDIEDVLAAGDRIRGELQALVGAEGLASALQSELEELVSAAAARARALSAGRKTGAERMGKLIGKELQALGMGNARVVVDVAPLEGGPAEFQVDGAKLGREGIDRVEFLIAPNPGVEPRPLSKIASGGELSRALLALKRVLADGGPAGLYVFDEVDAGVGGAVAERIGRAIRDVANHRQVLCITHLAPIAAFADAHFVVEKRAAAGATTTAVTRVEAEARLLEVARMLAGAKVTAAARKAAEEMVHEARATSVVRKSTAC